MSKKTKQPDPVDDDDKPYVMTEEDKARFREKFGYVGNEQIIIHAPDPNAPVPNYNAPDETTGDE